MRSASVPGQAPIPTCVNACRPSIHCVSLTTSSGCARTLPRFSLDPGITRQYLRSRAWLAGLASDLGGALLMVAAFSLAPVRRCRLPFSITPRRRLRAHQDRVRLPADPLYLLTSGKLHLVMERCVFGSRTRPAAARRCRLCSRCPASGW